MKKLILLLALSFPLFAGETLFTRYEAIRQGFLANKLTDVNKGAAALAAQARSSKDEAVAKLADAVAKAPDMARARAAFGPLSDELIKRRATVQGSKPAVYACPMVNKSWLQPKGKVGNPFDAAMKECGMLKTE